MWRWIIGIAIAILAFYSLYPIFNTADSPLLVVDMQNEDVLPRNFRMIEELHASGSAQFSEKSLHKILGTIPDPHTTIIDLRQESHGFLNGIAVSWYIDKNWENQGKSLAEIERNETERLQKALGQKFVLIYFSKKFPYPLYVNQASTEQELATSLGIGYKRIPVLDHHRPSDSEVDAFVAFVKNVSEDTWLHFHCAAGEGRTTTFLSMLDMMRHANKLSWEEILERQREAGGMDLLKPPHKNDWKYPYAIERATFLQKFHEYCKKNSHFEISWSNWINTQ
jgi:protein-tyrosine phosphatase